MKKKYQYFTYIWTRPSKKFKPFNWGRPELRQQEHKEGTELCFCWGTTGGNKSKHHKHFRPGAKSSLHRTNEHTNLKPSTVPFSASKDKCSVPPWDALCLQQKSTARTLLWGIFFCSSCNKPTSLTEGRVISVPHEWVISHQAVMAFCCCERKLHLNKWPKGERSHTLHLIP